jgi:hypothetical protein
MERYAPQQVKRALAQEQLLKRLEQGEDFEMLCEELGLSHSRAYADRSSSRPCLQGNA